MTYLLPKDYPRNRIDAIRITKILDAQLLGIKLEHDKNKRSKKVLRLIQILEELRIYFNKADNTDGNIIESKQVIIDWISSSKIKYRF
jgi:hypothetical protein